ncbi:unnamed protein product [Adineta steineri]|uniref:Uncharacterized protein n=1 Tax=Adineta steineri TaxID=433720 RepID=A0A815QND7_9BILA|nr:unnamed protein product [Adineta steineri]
MYLSDSTRLINGTCNQCLCISQFNYSALNCFPNLTCQLFPTFPLDYDIEVTSNARVYFPNRVFPNASQCMPNITYLLNKLKLANITIKKVSNPRDAIIDNNGYLVTIETYNNTLIRFDPVTLNITKTVSIRSLPKNVEEDVVTYFNGSYYIIAHSGPLTVIDSKNLTVISNISTSTIGIRDIIFLNNGQMMVVCSCDNNSLVFLNRTSLEPIKYNFAFRQSTSFACPHGMWRVNDTFFYVTAYTNMSLHSFSSNGNLGHWNETLAFMTSSGQSGSGAARVTIDGSGRFWFAYETDTVLIYDQEGRQLGNLTIPNSQIFDIKIMDNYLMYFTAAKTSQVMRLDPNIQC